MNNPVGICILSGSMEDAITARKAGADYCELPVAPMLMQGSSDEFAHLKQQLKAQDVAVPTCNLLMPGAMPLTGPQANLRETQQYLLDALRRMSQLGVRVAGFGAGPGRSVLPGESRDRALDQLAELLGFASETASDYGIEIALEPLRIEETNVFVTVAEAERFIRSRDLPKLKLMADFFHMQDEDDSVENLASLGDLLAHLHISDNDRLPPGQGHWDFIPLFSALKEIGYQGALSIEVDWADLEAESGPAINYVRAASTAAGLDQ